MTRFNRKIGILKSLFFAVITLMVPLIGMVISDEVNWEGADFIIGFLLIFCFVFLLQWLYFILPKSYRIVGLAIVIILFLLLWAELAVGIFGSPFAGE